MILANFEQAEEVTKSNLFQMKEGESLYFDSFLPLLSEEKIVCNLISKSDKYFLFNASWLGIYLESFSVEFSPEGIKLDTV